MKKAYPSKVSYGILFVIFAITIPVAIFTGYKDNFGIAFWFSFIILLLVDIFVLHLFLNTRYTIEDNLLKIQSGFFKEKPIEISEIKEIKKTNSIISAPAASFDRIEIKYKTFSTMIVSPKNKTEFIKHLMEINPNIVDNVKS